MVFKRKIYDKLKQWKELSGGSSAVLLEGARRIGKSTIVEEFARNEYDDYMILDFAKEGKDIKNNFTENMDDLDTFFRNLFLLKGRSLEGERCVIIFDEVQLFPQARQAIKYLVADGRYEYMETGSLISIRKNVTNILIPSEEYRIKMYPMDFEEYLWATGDNVTFEAMQSAFQHRKPLGDVIHRKIMQKFRTYMVVGGMPQAVNALVEGKTFAQIDFIKRNILSLYEEDLAKYDTENREKASVIFKTIPEQLENKNSHFRFSLIDKNARYQNYVDAVSFIAEAMIGNECINVTKPEVALELFADRSNFKLYMGDTGLLCASCMENIQFELLQGNMEVNMGSILENVFAQIIKSNGFSLNYFESKKYGELDFVIQNGMEVDLLEIKSGKDYKKHFALSKVSAVENWEFGRKIIFCSGNVEEEEGMEYLPWYLAMFYQVNKEPKEYKYEVDLSGLL